MTDDERFEQFLHDAAADYETPPRDVPREAMWNAINARRAARSVAPTLAHTRAKRWAWIGMAATLLVGVGIGRFALRDRLAPETVAATSPSAAVPVVVPSDTPVTNQANTAASTNVTIHTVGARSDLRDRVNNRGPAATPNGAYAIASARHLQRVQVLLASYAADAADARSDSLIVAWARGLLSNTRLLLDSPAARDPQRQQLLQDLEVILVQLVQRSPTGAASDRANVDRTLEKTQIIPRLRSALPAGLPSGTD